MPTQLSKIAFIEQADLTKTKVFSVFQEGAEGASRQVLSIEANTAILENNREVITSKVYTIDVVGLYSQADKSQVYTWASDRTELWVSGYGLDGSILQAYGTISVVDGYTDNASMRFRFQVESRGGYDATTGLHNANMSYAKNGFSLYRFQEGTTADIPAGWAKTSTGSPSFSITEPITGVYIFEMSCDSSSVASIVRDVYFPFVGQTVYFSVPAGTVVNTNDPAMFLSFLDSGGSTIGAPVTQVLTGSSTNVVSATCPSGAISVRFSVAAFNDDTVSFGYPVFSLKSGIVYGGNEFNT
jgi:hypothetical protein